MGREFKADNRDFWVTGSLHRPQDTLVGDYIERYSMIEKYLTKTSKLCKLGIQSNLRKTLAEIMVRANKFSSCQERYLPVPQVDVVSVEAILDPVVDAIN